MVLLPYAFTGWQPGTPYPLEVRALGIALIAAGGIVVSWAFTRFATEGRPVLLAYAAAFLVITVALAHWIEDPALARRFGAEFGAYRKQVPGWWPRWPRRRDPADRGTRTA